MRPVAVAVTGMGAVSPLGIGCDELWRALQAGADGIRPVERFSTAAFEVHLAATIPGWRVPAGGPGEGAIEIAVTAAREAWGEARLESVPAERVAVVLGTSLGTHREGFHDITEAVGDAIGACGPRLTVSVACTSSTNAIGLGRDLLASRAADVVVAGGTDVITDELFAGFHALGVLSRAPCAPFSDPPGTTLGEGAGFVVLERLDAPARRGLPPIAHVLGYGLSADAYHATAPDPSGCGVARALRNALEDAGLDPLDVAYVNAHATGTESNDTAEWRGIRTALGPAADGVAVSASKSFLGHAQGAAGVLEIICTLLAARHGAVPPTLHFTRARPHCPADPVASSRPVSRPWQHALCANSAFGGANAALALGRTSHLRRRCATRRDVFVAGAAALGPHGIDSAALEAALATGTGTGGRAAPCRLEALVRGAEVRGLDPSARFLCGAAALALAEAGGVPRGPARDRCGIVLGTGRLSAAAVREHRSSIESRGLARLSASAFTRMVLNAPAGACARVLGLRGPTSTLAAGHGAGLLAIVYAAELLAWSGAADRIIAAGVDELDDADPVDGSAEGAGCLALSAGGPPGAPRLAGWAFAGPGDTAGAVSAALDIAALDPGEVTTAYGSFDAAALRSLVRNVRHARDPERTLGRAPSAAATFAAVAAVREVRRGAGEVIVVADHGGRSSASAIVITTGARHG